MLKLKNYIGHIRNWSSLCKELNVDSAISSKSREEKILLKAYEKWGEDVADHLYGMFSFAIENEDGSIFCVRDHFGTKPFYYYVTDKNELLCSQNINDFIDHPDFKKELNEKMLQLYLTYTYVPGEETFFKGVKKLMPGHYMTFKNGKLEIKEYFNPAKEFTPDTSKSLEQWADEIHETLKLIMKEVKTDDETAESFLSSGVDSSYVLAVSDAKTADSCSYDDERFDESVLAGETAKLLGREHLKCLITPQMYFDAVPEVVKGMEQPLADASAVVFAIACKETAKHTKLCYSGEGADEFFGGYNMYRNAERYGENLKTFYIGNTNIMKEEEKKLLMKNYVDGLLPIDVVKNTYDALEGKDPLTKMSAIDIIYWLEGDIYLNVDKMSRAAGLEIRMPLTDRRIFNIAAKMPSKYKVDPEQNKVAFRTAASKVLPKEIAFRKKLGFIVPIRIWLADERYNKDVRELLTGKTAEKFFNTKVLNDIFEEYIGGKSDNWRKIWTVYIFLVWYREYFG